MCVIIFNSYTFEDEGSSDFTLLGETGHGVMENLSIKLKVSPK